MKKRLIAFGMMILMLSSCSFPGLGNENQAPGRSDSNIQSQKTCGDQVCDGPETAESCPEDCAVNQGAPQAGASEDDDRQPADKDTVMGQVYLDIQVSRSDGEGSCGEPPWGVDNIEGGDFSCVAPKYWYGYELVATAFQRIEITETGGGTWEISGTGTGGGTYQTASHWSDGQRVCEPVEVMAPPFDFAVTGQVNNGRIELELETLPRETSQWECDGGSGYERETTLLLIDAAIALNGSYQEDLSSTLDSEHKLMTGYYSRTYSAEMNPSPQNRDSAEVKVDFSCTVTSGDGEEKNTACPWEN